MINILKQWYERYFTDPQTVIFAFILVFGFLLIVVMNAHLMPILIGIIIAYLFEGLVVRMGQINLNRTIAASFATAVILTPVHGSPLQAFANYIVEPGKTRNP